MMLRRSQRDIQSRIYHWSLDVFPRWHLCLGKGNTGISSTRFHDSESSLCWQNILSMHLQKVRSVPWTAKMLLSISQTMQNSGEPVRDRSERILEIRLASKNLCIPSARRSQSLGEAAGDSSPSMCAGYGSRG